MNSRKGGRMAWRLAMPQLLAIALMPPGAANAQSASVSPAAQTDNGASAMKRLAYLVGSWAGMKKETGPDGKPQESLSTDDITAALDGEAIMIDGKAYGVGAAPSAKPIAKNFAVISAGAAPNRIRVTGFTPGGAVSSDGTVEADGSARWMMSWGSQILVFHIRPAAPDGWLETVKRSDDMGQTWHEFQIRFHRKEN